MSYLVEIQARYSEVLANCYELYQRGRRCLFEKQPEQRYTCSTCSHNESSKFCKANRMLKKLIRLLAEVIVAEGYSDEATAAAAGPQVQGAPITDEHIRNFRALNIAVALSSPKIQETIWLVPEHMGQPGLELTPEDIRIMEAAVNTFNGEILEIITHKQEVKNEEQPI